MKKRVHFQEERMRLAASLRLLRKERQYTQQEAADSIGLDRTTYTAYEQGKNLPNVFILERIAALYKISIDDIVHNPDVEYLFLE